jgi:murein DD-endopeptidase MepM/ murein hydrolase activator NlpD
MPDGSGGVRTFRVSRRVVRLAAATLATFLLLVIGFIASLGVDTVREIELLRLRAENQHLSRNLAEIQGQVTTLSESVDILSAKDQRFRLLAGLPHLDEDVRAVGIGGPAIPRAEREEFFDVAPGMAERTYAAAYDTDKLLRRVELLSTSIDEALDSISVHRDIFLSRPSIRPVQADESWISSSFSRSRHHPVLQYNRPHPGMDISARAGSSILATARGRVSFAGNRAGYGKTVELDHGFGYRTRYAHAASINVKRGQLVERGDELGLVGKTGLATAPHLHYEVMINGRQVNPREFLLDDVIYE